MSTHSKLPASFKSFGFTAPQNSDPRALATDATVQLTAVKRVILDLLDFVPVDERWYLEFYPDVRDAVTAGHISCAAEHYRLHGYFEGRLPYRPEFDGRRYADLHPDIADEYGEDQIGALFEHFVRFGYHEGRRISTGQSNNNDGMKGSEVETIPR